jgi:hypothetical protein
MLGDGRAWQVNGRGAVHVRVDGSFVRHRDGTRFQLPLTIDV